MKFEGILFDLDGTLVDTEPAAARAISDCFKSWGLSIEEADTHYITGRTWAKAFDYLFAKYRLPVPAKVASQAMIEGYRRNIQTEIVEVPGARDCVRALAKELPLALVSGSSRSEIFFALDFLGVRDLFQVILGAEDYPASKPAPDGYLKAMKTLGWDPPRILTFEDSEPGIQSAIAAGTKVVAIQSTNHFGQDTRGAHHAISDLKGVDPEWVRLLGLQLFRNS